ncbi:MAG: oligosaccharide flippase family protein [Deltaproteobacteria bacterium]|jgi:lipopolysaccharide exporter
MSKFVSSVVTLSTGTIIAQAIGILTAPILTRLFAPEAFGVLGFFTAISGIVGAMACLRYDLAIMLPRQDIKALNLFAGSILSTALISLMCVVLIGIAGQHLLYLFNIEQLKESIWLIPPMVFAIGTFSAGNYWYSRTKHFRRLAIIRIINSFASNSLKLAMGFAGAVGGGILVLAIFIGQFISNVTLYIKIWNTDGRLFRNHFEFREILNLFKRYRRFPQYEIWSGILVDLSLKLPVFTIAYFFSPKQLGYFVFVQTIVRVPFNLIGESISKVFFQKAASLKDNTEELSKCVENVFNFLTSFFMLPALVINIIGNDIFYLIFGSNWKEAGIYAQILIFSILVEFVTAPLGSLFSVLEKQKEALRFNTFMMSIRFTALVIGGLTGNILSTITIFVIADILARTTKFIYIFKQSSFKIDRAIGIFIRTLGLALPFVLCLILLKFVAKFNGLANICFAVVLITVNYLVLMHKNNLLKTYLFHRSFGISESVK